ncbi:MAG: TonB-dependent receptor, partial [Acidobacteriota bacterium]
MWLLLVGGTLCAQEKPDLASLSVDDLMNVEVTSVSRKAQKVADTAAAVFVITEEDIRRSGATSIPEVLRVVPGLDVARINGNTWAISARGSNGQYANKLLVMIDGRSVYSPLFSGVYWEVQDTLLEDVDRIEVIRGPGGTLWGANAVNGIINIITKHSVETKGALVSAEGGLAQGSSIAGRFGGAIGHNGSYRVYGKTFDRPASIEGLRASHDAWTLGRGGFRADWTSRRGDNFTAQADAFRGAETALGAFDPLEPFADRASLKHVTGEDAQVRWTAVQSSRSDIRVQASYDSSSRSQPAVDLDHHAFDADFQQHWKLGDVNDVVWGVAYRRWKDQAGGGGLRLIRPSDDQSISSAFLQDEAQLRPHLRLTVGTKLQYDVVSRLQFQPTVRLLFKASDRQTTWVAATSAVRTPSELELYGRVNIGAYPDGTGKTALIVLTGNPELKPERILTFEAGYRLQLIPNLVFDATAFHNRMSGLVATGAGQPFRDASGGMVAPIGFTNRLNGSADGAEFLFTDSVSRNWNVAFGYSFYRSGLEFRDASAPRHQAQVRSFVRLSEHVELDGAAFYVGSLGSDVPSYVRLDAQLAWRSERRWTVSVAGQNLLEPRHMEFAGT